MISSHTPRVFLSRYTAALTYLGALSTAQITALGPQPEGTLVYDTTVGAFLVYNAAGVPVVPPALVFSRTLYVDQSGAQFGSITAALAAAVGMVPTAADPITIIVYPGTYVESFTVPPFVSIIAAGSTGSTIVAAPVATGTVITLSPASSLVGISITGASGVGGIGLAVTAPGMPASSLNMSIMDCETGISLTGGGELFGANWLLRRFVGQTLTTAISVSGASFLDAAPVLIKGDAAARITTGISSSGAGTNASAGVVDVDFTDEPFLVDDSAEMTIRTANVLNADIAMHLGAVGAPAFLGTSVVVSGSTTWDLLVETAAGSANVSSSTLNTALISTATGSNSILAYSDAQPGDEGYTIIGELHVGRYDAGYESVFGEGDSYVNTMRVFTTPNDVVFTDYTSEAASSSGSTFPGLPGTGVGNILYIGGAQPFAGIKQNTTIAGVNLTGNTVWEYWNGGAWASFNIMSTDADFPYDQYANSAFERVNFEQIRFGPRSGWATTAVDGVTLYWIRMRVTAPITTVPTIEQIKLHSNRTEINANGFLEFFGDAEPTVGLQSHLLLTQGIPGSVPGNNNLDFSANVTLTQTDNQFNNGAFDGFGAAFRVPAGLDTSKPLTLQFLWAQQNNSAAGNVEFELFLTHAELGDVVDGTLAETTQTQVVAAPANQNELTVNSFTFSQPTLLPGELFAWSLIRDARGTNPDDTLVGNIYILAIRVIGTFWR